TGIAILLLPMVGFSQIREKLNMEDHDEKRIRFGINLGANRSHFSFTHHPVFMLPAPQDSITVVESVNSTGINLAWLVNFRLSEHFDLRTFPVNLTFTEKNFQYNVTYPDRPAGEDYVTSKKVQSISLSIPLQIKFSSDRIDNFKVYMMGGGRVEYDLASNAGARKAEEKVKLRRFDYGVEAGLGFHFYFPMFVLTPEIKMGWGLGNLHARDENLKYSKVIDKISSRMISFSLTVE
ncbi:MAG TPA: outer membrane beta-barrel protein, partial [Ferruginibacter sp.]|nr:outer membrane beta-barrel protein [Ferruginibacter sp.]